MVRQDMVKFVAPNIPFVNYTSIFDLNISHNKLGYEKKL